MDLRDRIYKKLQRGGYGLSILSVFGSLIKFHETSRSDSHYKLTSPCARSPFSFFVFLLSSSLSWKTERSNGRYHLSEQKERTVCLRYNKTNILSVLRTRVLDHITDHPLFIRVAVGGDSFMFL